MSVRITGAAFAACMILLGRGAAAEPAPASAAATAESAPAESTTAESAPAESATAASAAAAARVEHYLSGLKTWSADFEQTIDDADGKVLRSASGHLYLKRPGKFRWDYTAPSRQVVLADGKKLWFYDKDLQQANVRDMDSTLKSTPAVLLAGGATVSSQFRISALPAGEGYEWFQLIPKHPTSDFQAIRIAFANGELVRMLFADKLNQVTSLKFSNAKRNVTLAPALFIFTPPAGVDVIGHPSP
ncbi:MAG TPA: outer membrane lipoprotein chaperone LolA [Steroidobacteraceae bacterium]|nr:outer membrane lipoprotein chaperone LolA [Steroidobacteraceae bacterium]